MEKLEQYRQYVKQVITEYYQLGSSKDPIEQQLIFDTVSDHYQLMYVGWENRKRHHGCVLHLDIKDSKIWIQHDGTKVGIANELVDLGVPKEDIVLAFHEPLVREYTRFAVG